MAEMSLLKAYTMMLLLMCGLGFAFAGRLFVFLVSIVVIIAIIRASHDSEID